jgi:cyclopropane-fatty-acyl-phospholipid synthase
MNPALARRLVLGLLRRGVRVGQLTVVEGDRRYVFGSGSPRASVSVYSDRVWPLLLHGSRGMADAYVDGLWDSPDLTALVRIAARNVVALDVWRRRLAPVRVPLQALRGIRARNTRHRSRRDISAHYDLGNDLFELMLDDTMMYSCAYFPQREMSLSEASVAKLELICDKLDLKPGDRVLEIGTGWGGLAVHAALTRGCHVTTTTISSEQYEFACARVASAGVSDRVEVLRSDYRDLRGRFDKLVSVEMIEAVGWRDFDTFFRSCSERLEPHGTMLLQSIVIDDRAYEVEKASPSFIRSYIFPGGALPSLRVISRCVADETDMRMVGLEDLTPHYVETLRCWRDNFSAAGERLRELGYDERFQRLWRLYLSYCEGGFAENRIGVVQLLLGKPSFRSGAESRGSEARAAAARRAEARGDEVWGDEARRDEARGVSA